MTATRVRIISGSLKGWRGTVEEEIGSGDELRLFIQLDAGPATWVLASETEEVE